MRLMLRMICVTSSVTPGISANSWSTPVIRMDGNSSARKRRKEHTPHCVAQRMAVATLQRLNTKMTVVVFSFNYSDFGLYFLQFQWGITSQYTDTLILLRNAPLYACTRLKGRLTFLLTDENNTQRLVAR